MKGIGILPGNRPQYLDHLIPLCHLMNIPLLVTDPAIRDLAQFYYPPMEVRLVESLDFSLDEALDPYDTFFYVEFSRKRHGTFQFHEFVARKRARAVMSLHGNPDKYGDTYWIEKLADEDLVLAYGPQLCDLLLAKGVAKKPILSGNYRLEFYKAHEAFFDTKLFFKKERQTLLYAPTWISKERSSGLSSHYTPFFEVYKSALETLSQKYQVLVKLHPLMIKTMPDEVEQAKELFPEICFLNDSPLIYPLLKRVDLYLGDYSSIGYDFLYFDRPLFFLEPKNKTPLHECGHTIRKEELAHLGEFKKQFDRKKFYDYAFGKKKEWSELKQEIEDALQG